MSVVSAITTGWAAIDAAIPLIKKIAEFAEQGLSTDEIRERLGDPDAVGDDMIERITKREQRGRDLLGRDPNP